MVLQFLFCRNMKTALAESNKASRALIAAVLRLKKQGSRLLLPFFVQNSHDEVRRVVGSQNNP